ncbi:mitochondrial ubiquitin ligase activator of NFKB 1-like [Ciona intestinalis]
MFESLLQLVDERFIIESTLLALGSSLSAILYYLQHKYNAKADQLEDAVQLDLDSNLRSIVRDAPHGIIPYAAINGLVRCDSNPLSCDSLPEIKGVFWEKTTTEHKDVWAKYSNTWHSVNNTVSSLSKRAPFSLSKDSKSKVEVIDPEKSAWFSDSVEVVHDSYTPQSQSVVDSIVGFVSGERLKGFSTTEKMLRLGSKLCVIGEIVFEDNTLKIRQPAVGYGEYIVSKFSQSEIVSSFRSKGKFWKGFSIIIGASSVVAIYFIVKRLRKKWIRIQQDQRTQEELREVRLQRAHRARQANREPESDNDNTCVVCLTNPRECILLDCGHICVCIDCLEALPSPKQCPVCRSDVARSLPIFVA